jgi:hypothetical protein
MPNLFRHLNLENAPFDTLRGSGSVASISIWSNEKEALLFSAA